MGKLGGIPFDVGDILAKKYRLERLVGEGGTGLVVAAMHLSLERRVAIKFLRTALASDEIRMRFEREARAIGQIESEHVVLVLDVGALDDYSPYMVMEYLEGRDLAKILKEDGPLTLEDAVDCILQVCEVLVEAHAAGIVHRDLKPANLFLTRRDDGGPHIKVVDFGISKILDPKLLLGGPNDVTNAFSVLGSPRYMAPEQVRDSKDVDGRADLWSLGAVLFQLVTGKYAFDAENNVQASVAVLSKEPPLLRTLAPHAPPELEAIVTRCLTKDRTRRFQTAAELADALRPLATDRARDSLERLHLAKEAPNINIGLGVRSVGERVDSAAAGDAAREAWARGEVPPAPARPEGSRQMTTSPMAFRPGGPLSGRVDGPLSSGARPPAPPAPALSRAMKVGIAVAGLVVVLVAFGILAAVKVGPRSIRALRSAGAQPSFVAAPSALSPPAPRLAGAGAGARGGGQPGGAVTDTLDAGPSSP
jgi:serine/threonine-protein kinase